MSKGLDALERIKSEHYVDGRLPLIDKVRFKIIEKELKALEIIKETPEFAWYITIYENAYEMITDRKGFRVDESVKELQEKFDLLKEVLNDD